MDVSNRVEENRPEPGGQELIDTVVSLTGLPQPWVQDELGEILDNAGVSSGTCTLEQLRAAMLAYLESMEETVRAAEEAADSDGPGLLTPSQ
ncbi:MAG: hypothetical protein NDJ90_02070 [Oligoflexia bacterium]|nr:hypothetical protein [Oligoflexia bacterium]